MKRLAPLALAAACLALTPGSVLAWGSTGHRLVGEAAMRVLPGELPAFLQTPQAVIDVGEYSREPDRAKGAGRVHDSNRDPGHFLDLSDDGTALGGPKLSGLPATRAEYETALRAVGQDSWKAGYLPYEIFEGYQQLAQDFAYWRVLAYAERAPQWRAHRAWFAADRRRREALIIRDLGVLSHFVGDGSQPLHVTIHYNGWGDLPNPQGYTGAPIHEPFESDIVNTAVKPEEVGAQLAPLRLCDCSIEQRLGRYLAATGSQVEPLYQLEKAGGLVPGDPRGPAFATRLLAVGASELRDLVVQAWRDAVAPGRQIGWKPTSVVDMLAGKADPYPPLHGVD